MINDLSLLSERERTVLRLVATGATNQQIADQLDISANTVKVHVRNIFGKIGAASRTEATMYAVRSGLVTIGPESTSAPEMPLVADLPPLVEPVASVEPVALDSPPNDFADSPQSPAVSLDLAPLPTEPTRGLETAAPQRGPLSLRIVGIVGVLVGVVLAIAISALQGSLGAPAAGSDPPGAVTAVASGISSTWQELAAPGRRLIGAAAVNYGPIFVIGGASEQGVLDQVQRYDPISNTWTQLNPKPTAVRDVHGVVLGGKIYVPGGRLADGSSTNVLEIYDLKTGTWSKGAALPAPRSAYGLAAVEGLLYLFGGWDGQEYRAEVLRYDPVANQWLPQTPMSVPRAYLTAVTFEDRVYVMGGESGNGALTISESYTPASEGAQPWNSLAPLPSPRSRCGGGLAANLIYLFGGTAGDEMPLRYDVRTDSWPATPDAPLLIGAQPGVAQRDGSFFIVGGGSDQSPSDRLYAFKALYNITLPGQQ